MNTVQEADEEETGDVGRKKKSQSKEEISRLIYCLRLPISSFFLLSILKARGEELRSSARDRNTSVRYRK